jgi:hypothetical protein
MDPRGKRCHLIGNGKRQSKRTQQPFRADHVGACCRSSEVRQAREDHQAGRR